MNKGFLLHHVLCYGTECKANQHQGVLCTLGGGLEFFLLFGKYHKYSVW